MSANIIQLFLGAARKGDIGTVRSLYESGQIVDIDGDDPLARNGFTALMRAASCGKLEVVQYLVEVANATIDFTHKETGSTALMMAAEKNQSQVVEYLLNRGADLKLENADGKTAHIIAIERRMNCGDVIRVIERFVVAHQHTPAVPSRLHLPSRTVASGSSSVSTSSSPGGAGISPAMSIWQASGAHPMASFQSVQSRSFSSAPSARSTTSAISANLVQQYLGAARKGNVAEVQNILEAYPIDVDVTDGLSRDGYTALMRAATTGKRDVIMYLVEKANATIDLVHPATGNTALLFAAEKNHSAVVEYLLQKGANYYHCNHDGKTAFDLAMQRQINCGDVLNVLQRYRAASVAPSPPTRMSSSIQYTPQIYSSYSTNPLNSTIPSLVVNQNSNTNLMQQFIGAARRGNIEDVRKMLPAITSIDETDPITKDGFTALMRAASAGKKDMVKFLIEQANASVDIVNATDGNTALLYAVDKNHHEIVEYLLEQGANIQHRNANGEDALTITSSKDANAKPTQAVIRSYLGDSGSAIFVSSTATTPNKPAIFATPSPSPSSITASKSSVTTPSTTLTSVRSSSSKVVNSEGPRTPLEEFIVALEQGDLKGADKIYSQNEIDIDEVYDGKLTPLMVAVQANQLAIVEALIDQFGATPDVINDQGETALMIAVKHDNLEILQTLIAKGSNIANVNKNKRNVLQIAKELKSTRCLEYLKQYFPKANSEEPVVVPTVESYNREQRPPSPTASLLSNFPVEKVQPPEPPVVVKSKPLIPPRPPQPSSPSSSFTRDKDVAPFIKSASSIKPPLSILDILYSQPPKKTLLQAVMDNDLDSVRRLIIHGADVNELDQDNHSILYLAIDRDDASVEIIQALLQAEMLWLMPQLENILFVVRQRGYTDLLPIIKVRAFDELHPFMNGIPTALALQITGHTQTLSNDMAGCSQTFEELRGLVIQEIIPALRKGDSSLLRDQIATYQNDVNIIWTMVGTSMDDGTKVFDVLYAKEELSVVHILIVACQSGIESLTKQDKFRYLELARSKNHGESIEFWTKELTLYDKL